MRRNTTSPETLGNGATDGEVRVRADGFTLVELLVVVAIIGILAALAVPGLLRARMSGNEASAIGSLRAINSAEFTYASSASRGGFAASLPVLGSRCPASSEAFLPAELSSAASIQKSGYTVTLRAGVGAAPGPPDCNGVVSQTTYYASAAPVAVGASGLRAFATSERGTVWQSLSGVAPPQPFAAPATPLP